MSALRSNPWLTVVGVAVAVTASGCDLDDPGGASEGEAAMVRVVRVVDGDTLLIALDGAKERVRMIGIDTPETVQPGMPVECGGPEATASLKRLARPGDRVRLIQDPSQDSVDDYGRLLRYVQDDGEDLGEAQVERGLASVYVYDEEFERVDRYRGAESHAREADRGVWSACEEG